MRDEKFWQEGMDGKRFALCLFRKIWILPAAGIVCAAVVVCAYLLFELVLSGEQQYQVFSQYRIYFDSEKYGLIDDYYNAYTWGEIMKTDQVLDFVMEELPPEITKEQVKASVSVGQMSDVKIMPLTVTSEDPAVAELIAQAYVPGLDRFAKSIEGLTGMDCWLVEQAEAVPRATRTVHAGGFGFGLGVAVAFLVMLLYYALDDSVYAEEDLSGKFEWPVLGVLTNGNDEGFQKELVSNWKYILKDKEKIRLVWIGNEKASAGERSAKQLQECIGSEKGWIEASWPFTDSELEQMRENDGVVLMIPWGNHNGRFVAHVSAQLEKQQIHICGAVICGAQEKYLKMFYGKGK